MAEIAGFRESFAAGLAGVLAEVSLLRCWMSGRGGCCWGRVRAGWDAAGSELDRSRDRRGEGHGQTWCRGVGSGDRGRRSGARARRRAEAGRADRPAVVAGAGRSGGSRDSWGPDVAAAVDDQVDGQARRGVDLPGAWVAPTTVARLLKDNGYSLQGNAKTIEGKQAPRPRRPVPLPQRSGQRVSRRRPAGGSQTIRKRRNWSGSTRTAAGSTSPRANRPRPTPTTSSARPARRQGCGPTGCMTWAPTPAGSTWAPTPTPECSPSSRSAAGGPRSGGPTTRGRTGC